MDKRAERIHRHELRRKAKRKAIRKGECRLLSTKKNEPGPLFIF